MTTPATTHTGRVFVVGSLNVDTVIRLQRHPRVGETVHALDAVTAPGGKGGNQAAAAALAGVDTHIVGRIGSDAPGQAYREHLLALGIDCTLLGVDAGPSGQATVMVNTDGDNSIIVLEGANGTVTLDDVRALAPLLRAGDVLTTQYESPADVVKLALELAREAGAFSILNPSPWQDRPELTDLADLVVVNALEAEQLGRSEADAASDERLCLTLGEDGARWGDVSVPARRITPVDTTGAGDAFTGTLAAGIARGDDRRTALTAAVAAASEACLHPNAQRWAIPA